MKNFEIKEVNQASKKYVWKVWPNIFLVGETMNSMN